MEWYNFAEQPFSRRPPVYDEDFEIDEELILQVPKYRGALGEDPIPYLRNFHLFCVAKKPIEVELDKFKYKVFPYSLTNYAKVWFSFLCRRVFPTWKDMRRVFMNKYSLEVQEEAIREMITSIKQYSRETTYEYLERFYYLLDICPNHGLREYTLIMSLLEGMNSYERETINIMAGGSIMDCTPSKAWDLIYERAEITRPFELSESTYVEHNEDIIEMTPQEEQFVHETSSESEKLSPNSMSDVEVIEPTSDKAFEEEEDEEDEKEEFVQENATPTTHFDDLDSRINDENSLQDSNITTMEDNVSACNSELLHTTNTLHSSLMHDSILEEALDNRKVWTSLDDVKIQIPMVKACIQIPNPKKLLHEVHINWKSYKEAKRVTLDEKASFFLPQLKKHYTFGWKPGWDSCGMTFEKMEKKLRKPWRKFDGVHPWAPNI